MLESLSHVVSSVRERLCSDSFKEAHRLSDKFFVRERKLPFVATLLFHLSVLKCSLQLELNQFFEKLHDRGVPVHYVCSMSFCKARKKFSYTAFIDLADTLVNAFYGQHAPLWNGYRLVSVDGTKYYLPYNEETVGAFGAGEKEKPYVLARGSMAYDVMGGIVIDAAIDSEAVSENTMFYEHTKKFTQNDLVLADRGYTAFWIMALLTAKDTPFCIRMNTSQTYGPVKEFLAGEGQDMVVTLSPTKKSVPFLNKYNIKNGPVKVRLVKVLLETGETEVLATSLFDEERSPTACFKALYHLRWPVEEAYKSLKGKMEIENFSGKSPQAIKQDFYAKIFSLSLAGVFSYIADKKIVRDTARAKKKEKNKYGYKVNLKGAIGIIKASMSKLFSGTHDIGALLKDLLYTMCKNTHAIRPNRKCPREGINKKRYHMCYKPC